MPSTSAHLKSLIKQIEKQENIISSLVDLEVLLSKMTLTGAEVTAAQNDGVDTSKLYSEYRMGYQAAIKEIQCQLEKLIRDATTGKEESR